MQISGIIEWKLRRKYSLPETFKFFSWQCMPKASETIYYELSGGVPQRVFKSGPRKGRPDYSTCTDTKVFYMQASELASAEQEYIQETGNCSECMGEGQTLASVGVRGTTYRECRKCAGTGKDKAAIVGSPR